MKIQILGGGCQKCHLLADRTAEALKRLQREAEIENVTDFAQIAAMGVLTTPAFAIDGKVLHSGRVLGVEEVMKLVQDAG